MKYFALISILLFLTPSAFAAQNYRCGDHSTLVKIGTSNGMKVYQYRPDTSRYSENIRWASFDFNVYLSPNGEGTVVDQNGSQVGTVTESRGYMYLNTGGGRQLGCYNVPVDTSGGSIEYTRPSGRHTYCHRRFLRFCYDRRGY